MEAKYNRPNIFIYRFVQLVAMIFSAIVFKRKIIRNEIKHAKGPFVVIANHQAAYDFVNLIGTTSRPMTFVLSNSFYNTLPFPGILNGLGVIPKQQFQTSVSEMKKIKAVIDNGAPLVIYPAGLMCEDGISTPIPRATYKFLKWLGVDVYVAKTSGTYFAQPKWSKGFRPGKTHMDIYKLFDQSEIRSLSVAEIRAKAEAALAFDAYREQEELLVKYDKNDVIEGLEKVLYMCPHCGAEFSIQVKNRRTIYCTECGYEETSDEFAFLHNEKGIGNEIRYVSDWSRHIFEKTKDHIRRNRDYTLNAATKILMLDYEKHKFKEVGAGNLSLSPTNVSLSGTVNGEELNINMASTQFPSLPFTPGKYLELQNGKDIYRLALNDSRLVMKFINLLKASSEIYEQEVLNI